MENVQNMDVNAFADIFGGLAGPTIQNPGFNGQGTDEPKQADILTSSTTETTTVAPVIEGEKEEKEGEAPSVDILETPAEGGSKPGRKPKYDFSDMSGYYQDRVKAGKFVKIEEEDETGEKKLFVPKTPEDFDEVIELQLNHRLQQKEKEIAEKWYASKSPAWKAISQYAEMVDDPTELIPFLQGVRNIQSVQTLDENEIDGAEQIVRIRMEQRGDPESAITAQIDALKTTDKLITTAKEVKPIIVHQEQQALIREKQMKDQREMEYQHMISTVRENAIKAIESPIFGKQKLKREEQAIVYDLIGYPSEETQGYGIYTEIDKLFDSGDFETLKQVALLVAKKDSFYNYLGTSVADKTHASLEKKLRVAGEGRTSSGNDFDEEPSSPTIQRSQFSRTPRFGK
jgi:hypothetical protein